MEIEGDLKSSATPRKRAEKKSAGETIKPDTILIITAQLILWMSMSRPPQLRPAWELERDEIKLLSDPLAQLINTMIDRLPEKARELVGSLNDLIGVIVGLISINIIIKERENELVRKAGPPSGFPGGVPGFGAGSNNGSGNTGVYAGGGTGGDGGGAQGANPGSVAPNPVSPPPEIVNLARKLDLA